MPKDIIRKFPILIIGSGPAGCATALNLVQSRPSLARLILVIEKFRHPRPKVCAGGITAKADILLQELGAACDVPYAETSFTRIVFENRWVRLPSPGAMRVVQRNEFDAALAEHVRARGVTLLENEPAMAIKPLPGGMEITTSRSVYHAQAVVGADGVQGCSNSLFKNVKRTPWAALMTTMPLAEIDGAKPDHAEVEIDFSCLADNLPGYIWRFPCWMGDKPTINYGICALRSRNNSRINMADVLAKRMQYRGIKLDRKKLLGSFGYAYSPKAPLARPHILLAGDTAGLDELTGEGVRQSLMFGKLAADEICRAIDKSDYSFANYSGRVRRSELGHELMFSARMRRLQKPGAVIALMNRISQKASLGRALIGHVSGKRTMMKNPYPFAAHAFAALGARGLKLVKTLFQAKEQNFD